jgi:hypothetical protein
LQGRVVEISDWPGNVKLYDGENFYAYGHTDKFKVNVAMRRLLSKPLAFLAAPEVY